MLAVPVPELAATVTVEPADGFAVGHRRFPDLASLLATRHEGDSRLVTAAIARLASWMRENGSLPPSEGFSMMWRTTIPRSVGLAGSSALVIGALRSLARLWDTTIPDEVGPRLALEVEVDRLGIAAGPQDRLVQWHESTLLMDFGSGSWSIRAVHPPAPIDLLVCWTDAARRPSHATHAPLQDRRDEPEVRERMAALAELARQAASALQAGDVDTVGQCMDAGLEHRGALVSLERAHVELVEQLRRLGAAATYAGSGGAVVALAPDLTPLRDWATQLGLRNVTTAVT
ncbi:MAG: glucuronokinase [Acidimicrobiaceae bacterium]